MVKKQADFSNFDALDIRIGKIVSVNDSLSKKPTYKSEVALGSKIF